MVGFISKLLTFAFFIFCLHSHVHGRNAAEKAYDRGDYQTAFRIWEAMAYTGQIEAEYFLGRLYYHGLGVDQSDEKAFLCFNRAASFGHGKAMHNLAIMYYNGEGIGKNIQKSILWHKRAFAEGITRSAFILGETYFKHQTTPHEYIEALRNFRNYLKKIAEEGSALEKTQQLYSFNKVFEIKKAQRYIGNTLYLLGLAYFRGEGCQIDIKKSLHYFNLAAGEGNPYALYSLGRLYEKNNFDIPPDKDAAYNYLYLAATKGSEHALQLLMQRARNANPQALYQLGKVYQEGFSGPYFQYNRADKNDTYMKMLHLLNSYKGKSLSNIDQALKLYKAAANEGFSEAQHHIGVIYEQGLGEGIDLTKAFEYYFKAANQVHIQSMFDLGRMYEKGKGVSQDSVLAHMWYTIAATLGHVEATSARAALEQSMPYEQVKAASKLSRKWSPNNASPQKLSSLKQWLNW